MKIVCLHLNQVGDLVFSLPAIKNLRDGFPQAQITSVVRPGLDQLLNCSGLVDDVVVRRRGLGTHKLALIRLLRSRGFDLAVVFSQSAGSVLLAYLSGAGDRVGFCGSSLPWLLTKRVAFQHPPSTSNNLRLVESIGCRATAVSYAGLLRPTAEADERAAQLLERCGIKAEDGIAGLVSGTSQRREIKKWTDAGFEAVGNHLASLGMRVVILGAKRGTSALEDNPGFENLCGLTDLAQALAIVARCRVVVGVDSGLLHLAAAAGTRVVGIYGPTDPRISGPQGGGHLVVQSRAACSPCKKVRCSLNGMCMAGVDAGEVIEAVDKVLACSNPA